MQEPVLVDKRDRVLWITINRPERRNALNPVVLQLLHDAFTRVHCDKDILAAVLTGDGDRAFCTGADLQPGTSFEWDYAKPNAPVADIFRLVRSAPVPVIARVNGFCMAGGIGLMASCSMAVAADTAIFGVPEVKLGIFAMQVFSALQPLVPPRLLHEWCVIGEPFDAKTALEAGLLNYVVPRDELDAKVDWLLSRITDKSPVAVRRGIYAMRAVSAMNYEQSLAYMETQVSTISLTEDAKEGLAAFSEKRKPVWKGR